MTQVLGSKPPPTWQVWIPSWLHHQNHRNHVLEIVRYIYIYILNNCGKDGHPKSLEESGSSTWIRCLFFAVFLLDLKVKPWPRNRKSTLVGRLTPFKMACQHLGTGAPKGSKKTRVTVPFRCTFLRLFTHYRWNKNTPPKTSICQNNFFFGGFPKNGGVFSQNHTFW